MVKTGYVLIVRMPTRDNLGNESVSLGMKVFYDMDKIKNANWSNMVTFDYMEIADDIEFKRLGKEYVVEYCRGDSAKFSPRFCARI